ncbi:MAG: GDSL-type esterase/lipase family protein [Candidatus Sumerlaeales bacterium]|nr:GDSL-type esterase/lipase family protein [Candidatus Sumerlaeales bacterium]
MKDFRKRGLQEILAAASLSSAFGAYQYQADKADTAHLWGITDKAERVRVDSERRDWYYGGRMDVFLDEKVTTGGVVFLGDSITDRFPIDEVFPNGIKGKTVWNRGIGGDRIEGVLERLDISVMDLQPSELHVLIGGNDVLWPVDYTKGNLTEGYRRLFRSLKVLVPSAKIYAYTLPPLDEHADRLGTCVQEVVIANEQLKDVCRTERIECRDLYASLATPEGHFKHGMTMDGIHLSRIGYLNWIDLILGDISDKFEVWKRLAASWSSAPVARITGWNIERGKNMMIVFQEDENTTSVTTLTNDWGTEALVKNGKVADIVIGGNMPMPKAPDYVLSGHGLMSDWIRVNCVLGLEAEMAADGKTVSVASPVTEETVDRYAFLRGELLKRIAQAKDEATMYRLKDVASNLNDLRLSGIDEKQMQDIRSSLADASYAE